MHTNVTNNNAYNGDSGNNYMGGMVGHNQTATTSIIGCVYDGTLTSQGFKGGFIGFIGDGSSSGVFTIKDSYFGGNYSANGYSYANFSPIGCKPNKSWVLNLTSNNFYYNIDAGTFSAANYNAMNNGITTSITPKHGYTVTGVSPVNVSMWDTPTTYYDVSKIGAYANALVYDGTIIAANNAYVYLNLSVSGNSGTLSAHRSLLTLGGIVAAVNP